MTLLTYNVFIRSQIIVVRHFKNIIDVLTTDWLVRNYSDFVEVSITDTCASVLSV